VEEASKQQEGVEEGSILEEVEEDSILEEEDSILEEEESKCEEVEGEVLHSLKEEERKQEDGELEEHSQ